MMTIPMLSISGLNGSHECYKFAGNDPIKVSILDSLVVFILLYVECLKVVPPEFYGVFKTLQAMQKCAIVEAITF